MCIVSQGLSLEGTKLTPVQERLKPTASNRRSTPNPHASLSRYTSNGLCITLHANVQTAVAVCMLPQMSLVMQTIISQSAASRQGEHCTLLLLAFLLVLLQLYLRGSHK